MRPRSIPQSLIFVYNDNIEGPFAHKQKELFIKTNFNIMGFFGPDKKQLSMYEWREEVRSALYNKNFRTDEIDRIEGLFWTDLNEPSEYEKGIDRAEFEEKIKWLSQGSHMGAFYLTPEKIQSIKDVFEPYL